MTSMRACRPPNQEGLHEQAYADRHRRRRLRRHELCVDVFRSRREVRRLNACKGQSACKSANSACKGQNACKGQGFTEAADAAACTAKGGKVM